MTQAAGVRAVATAVLSSNATGGTTVNLAAEPKAIQELFEMDYGRMNATLGVELPFTNSLNQTTLPMGYTEPTTEYLKPSQLGTQIGTARDGTAIWKITHNGVDTHTIHFHLMDVQLINRVGWDGAIRPPDDNEMGWKESVRMNPLEDAIVAMRPATPELPFKIGESIRSTDPTMPANHQMSAFDPATGQAITFANGPVNMGWEYVWHCHLLGHEENDMMREVNFAGSPDAPTLSSVARTGPANARTITATWANNANWQLTNFVVQRSTNANFTGAVQTLSDKSPTTSGAQVNWQGGNTTLGQAIPRTATSFVDATPGKVAGTTYFYRVRAESAQGYSVWSNVRSARF
jgi:FtsP/CotA-like multicopper oxidase with cupredoxin domain